MNFGFSYQPLFYALLVFFRNETRPKKPIESLPFPPVFWLTLPLFYVCRQETLCLSWPIERTDKRFIIPSFLLLHFFP